MSDSIISVSGLSKKYRVFHADGSHRADSFREYLTHSAKNLFSRKQRVAAEDFLALNDVSFEIKKGEKVGIVGRNGAGKSTLLKVLSRIIEPTKGSVRIQGRVSSLLEVGTGFHPELTGRENIFLNGAILGMSRAEILEKFDSIVAFSEIEQFIDTPVKRYSSGMYVRLAFSVAAHLEPDILILDEVLAVGDVQFQKKCLGKLDDAHKQGKTIIFVSHDTNVIERYCDRIIHLEKGKIRRDTKDVIGALKEYLSLGINRFNSNWQSSDEEYVNEYLDLKAMRLVDSNGASLSRVVSNNEDIWAEVEVYIKKLEPNLTFGFAVYTEEGKLLFWTYSTDQAELEWPKLSLGKNILRVVIPKRFFNEGTYQLEFIASLHFVKWIMEPSRVNPSLYITIAGGLSESPYFVKARPGILAPVLRWTKEC